ncbi:hypothetical protein CP532_6109 [Ophiocordyceps camponoti-leonardi (nom. inval.)]|nr:hypothetical protein CP532_6109 [Ophiocordyceps camponoti-leonardi (nom. inval.)]
MIPSTRLLTATTTTIALLTSTVTADLGCHAIFETSGVQYYNSPSGCCAPEFATIIRDSSGAITDARCGHVYVKGHTDWLNEIGPCNKLYVWAPTCAHIRYPLEGVPQMDDCTAGMILPNPDYNPSDDRGCYNGRVYAHDGKCCSIDYVVSDKDGTRCGKKPVTLGPDNQIPPPLVGVPRCSRVIEQSDCPNGVFASLNALIREQKCLTCCPPGYTRDHNYNCRMHDSSLFNLAKYWRARKRDGCELPKPGIHCCPDRRHSRNSRGECSARNGRELPTATELYIRRIERDGCTDYLDKLDSEGGDFDLDMGR